MTGLLNEIKLKLLLLGNGGVGKTSLIQSITGQDIQERYIPTIGSNIIKKDYLIEESNTLVSVNLWELGGQRAFNPLNPVFFNNVDIAFIIFDLSKPQDSITNIKNIYLDNLKKKSAECIVFIVGNKLDLDIEENTLKNLIKEQNLGEYPLIFISALKKKYIEELIDLAIYYFLKEKKNECQERGIDDLSNSFLKLKNARESDLNSILVNSEQIDISKVQKKHSLVVSKKKIDKNDIIKDKSIFLKERFKDLGLIKALIKSTFNQNILSIEYMIANLKKTPINSLEKSIDKTLDELRTLKSDFELKLNSLIDLDNLPSNKLKDNKDQNIIEGV
ncbi:MAG: GTP-binding protein [Candidatus Lokiarchaeota archaeon]|nr:GTP-binding protein [Candidatus Lokiarchaeota archaeon]